MGSKPELSRWTAKGSGGYGDNNYQVIVKTTGI
jgi:hypothetical protein